MLQPTAGHPADCHTAPPAAPWQVLVVAEGAAGVNRAVQALQGLHFLGRRLQLHCGTSRADALQLLQQEPEMAVALIDLALDAPQAGLVLVDHIREVMGNRCLRIVLRGGQRAGMPARRALAEHDVNGCVDTLHGALDEADGTDEALRLAVLGALRSYGEVQALHAAVQALQQRAITDQLTGLHNASHLAPTLERALSSAQRRGEPLSVVFLDVDDFKDINDEQGHLRGDEVLRQVGAALLDNSRLEDCCFRYGGDEFVVVLPNCTLAQVQQRYLPRLQQAFARLGLSVSHGACDTGPAGYIGGQALLRQADERMYERKRQHRSRKAGGMNGHGCA